MSIPAQRYRQIHLDFHTAAECGVLGERFNGDAFAARLNPSGGLVWNTFLGGAGGDEAWKLTTDGQPLPDGLQRPDLGNTGQGLQRRLQRCLRGKVGCLRSRAVEYLPGRRGAR